MPSLLVTENGAHSRVAIYLRVSDPTRQFLDGQRAEVERFVELRGWSRRGVYEDTISGVKKRPGLERLVRDAQSGLFDLVAVFAIDRVGRSFLETLNTLLQLEKAGVRVVSVAEQWLDTSGPVRDLLLSVLTWAASMERTRLIERTLVGVRRARAAGVRFGRPRAQVDMANVLALRADGKSIRQIAKAEKVGAGTIHRLLTAHAALAGRVPNHGGAEDSKTPRKCSDG